VKEQRNIWHVNSISDQQKELAETLLTDILKTDYISGFIFVSILPYPSPAGGQYYEFITRGV